MHETPDDILLVTPVWNDSARLSRFGPELARVLAASPLPVRWVIADDGSGPEETGRLRVLRDKFAQTHATTSLHLATEHRGKGAIVREAWSLHPQAAWLAFTDADGAVSAEEILRLIDIAAKGHQNVIGIRKRTPETKIVESARRSLTHHSFILAAHLVLGLTCEDPQCGAKVIRGADFRVVAPLLEEDGFAFDCELLTRLYLEGFSWLEVPVNWTEMKGGKVRFPQDAWRMFKALFRIRRRVG